MNKINYSCKKKIMSLLLAAIMLAAIIAPLNVAADTDDVTSVAISVDKTNVVAGEPINITVTITDQNADPVNLDVPTDLWITWALPSSGVSGGIGNVSTTTTGVYTTSYTFNTSGSYTITATANSISNSKGVTVNQAKEATPSSSDFKIDYGREMLEFVGSATYIIDNISGTFSSGSEISISNYIGTTLQIRAKGTGGNADSNAYSISLSRPSTPVSGSGGFSYSSSNDTITISVSDKYEWSTSRSSGYTALEPNTYSLGSTTYYLRVKATSGSFASDYITLSASGSGGSTSSGTKEATPSAWIDYSTNYIRGLVPYAYYTINGSRNRQASASGAYPLSSVSGVYDRYWNGSNWVNYDPYNMYYNDPYYWSNQSVIWDAAYGQWKWWDYSANQWRYSTDYPNLNGYGYYITIIREATSSGRTDSNPQSLAYYNPGYAYDSSNYHLSVSHETGAGYNDGYIYGLMSGYTYEYKLSSQSDSYYAILSRSSSNSSRSVNLAPGTYDVRISNYYNYNYNNYLQTLTIYPYGASSGGPITITAPTFPSTDYAYTSRPSAQYISLYNTSSQTAYISSVTVSGSAFELTGNASAISARNYLSSSYLLQPKYGLPVGTYTETITVKYTLGSSGAGYTSSAQVTFTVYGDYYYDYYYDGYYYPSGSSAVYSKAVTDQTRVSQGSVDGILSYYNQSDKYGDMNITVTGDAVTNAIQKMISERQRYGRSSDLLNLEINVTTAGGGISQVNVQFAKTALTELVNASVNLTIATNMGSITFPSSAVRTINAASSTGSLIKITTDNRLPNSAVSLVGGRPVLNFDVYGLKGGNNRTQVSSFNAGVTCSIKYTPTANEDPNKLGAYKISGGKATLIENSSYVNGMVTWTASSISQYAVGYQKPAPEFDDTAEHWAKSSIQFVAARGMLTATEDNLFSPETQITRAMFITALGRASGDTISKYASAKTFSDVDKTSVYHPYIEWAYANKIIELGGGNFEPSRPITREEMAVMMYKYASYAKYTIPEKEAAINFDDAAKISAGAKTAVKAMQTAGILKGKDDNLFDPQGKATRAEASAVLQRFVVNIIDAAPDRGWVQTSPTSKWQHINGKGEADKGIMDISGSTYYFDPSGYMAVGWATVNGSRYYFEDNGAMVKAKWVKIGDSWYFFYADGSLAVNTTVEGYKVDSTGARK